MLHWVQTIACVHSHSAPMKLSSRWHWEKIWEDSLVQFWVCSQDLKDSFVKEALNTFGKRLEQVVKLGSHPEVLYPVLLEGEE